MKHTEYQQLSLTLVAMDATELKHEKMQSTLTLRLEATAVAELFR